MLQRSCGHLGEVGRKFIPLISILFIQYIPGSLAGFRKKTSKSCVVGRCELLESGTIFLRLGQWFPPAETPPNSRQNACGLCRKWSKPQAVTNDRQIGGSKRRKPKGPGDRTKICGIFFLGKSERFFQLLWVILVHEKWRSPCLLCFFWGVPGRPWILGIKLLDAWWKVGFCWKMTGSHMLKKLMPFNSSCFKQITYTPSIWQTWKWLDVQKKDSPLPGLHS